jgi:hypothetical protein
LPKGGKEIEAIGMSPSYFPKKFRPNTPDFLAALHDRGVDNVMKHMFVVEPLQNE